jgi:glycerol-3-phosphate dehydrogenase (NAD(P)+)
MPGQPSSIQRVAVLGAGAWGTAFGKVLGDAGRHVTVWARRGGIADAVNSGENVDYLPGVWLPAGLEATVDPAAALAGADAAVLAVPSQSLRENLARWAVLLPHGMPIVSLAKGVELGTLKRMSEVIHEVAGVPRERICVITGPNLATEIGQCQPTACVVACEDHELAVAVQRATGGPYFRPYTNHDVTGCELGGACKNVIALACGIAVGLGFGSNTAATLITRGLAEIMRLGVALGADPLTLSGLAGLGDLVATCSSPLSRNRQFGERLGEGESVAEAQAAAHGQVAEGAKSCTSIRELARRHQVDMPITQAVHAVCHGGLDARHAAGELLERAHKREWAASPGGLTAR